MDRTVDVFDISRLLTEGIADVPLIATWSPVVTEKLSAQVLQGKQFFYDAQDTRLALHGYLSCASCHNDGGHDGRVWDLTGFGEGLRNTTSLRGRAGAQGFLHWSNNFDEVQDFEGQIRNLAGGSGLMTDEQFNTGTRSQPLGDRKAGVSTELDALAAYAASLTSFAPSPLRNPDGTLTAAAIAGRQLFQAKNCASCHGGNAFTNSGSSNPQNIGTITADSGNRLGGPLTGIDIPTLRDVWATAPYLHLGSAATIGDAIQAHDGLILTGTELANLAAYVSQIGSQELTSPGGGADHGHWTHRAVLQQHDTVRCTWPADGAANFYWAVTRSRRARQFSVRWTAKSKQAPLELRVRPGPRRQQSGSDLGAMDGPGRSNRTGTSSSGSGPMAACGSGSTAISSSTTGRTTR